jgi:tetratricopeptide (TPR) repeat protein
MDKLLTDQLTKKAKVEYEAGNYLQAANMFEEASQLARDKGDILQAAELENNRSVALLKAGNPQGALDAVVKTDQIFAAAGDIAHQGMALGNLAAALEALNKLVEAEAAYEQSAELFRQTGDMELRAVVLKSLSAIQIRSGHYLESLVTMQAALESQKKLSQRERILKKLLHTPFRLIK